MSRSTQKLDIRLSVVRVSNAADQLFPLKYGRQKDLIEPACLAYVPTLDTFKVGDIEGPARKFRTQAELSRGENHAQSGSKIPHTG